MKSVCTMAYCYYLMIFTLVISYSNPSLAIRARSSDCPHPCVVNGHHFCYPPPCPPPACADPIYAPGQCCTLCPDDCPHGTCTINNRTMCYPIPCPHPPCENPVINPGDCCPHCPSEKEIQKKEDCPHPCNIGGQTYCHPIPCPLPLCDKPETSPGDCCPHSCEYVATKIGRALGITKDDESSSKRRAQCSSKSGQEKYHPLNEDGTSAEGVVHREKPVCNKQSG